MERDEGRIDIMKRILCFGDSNAWGHIPAKGTRYDYNVRWPGVAAQLLGDGYQIIEDNISGRTTIFEDPERANRCGLKNLGYSLIAHMPVDLVVIALGSNDLKFTDAEGSKAGLEKLVDTVYAADELFNPPSPVFSDEKRVLIVGPAFIAPEIETLRPEHRLAHAAEQSKLLTVNAQAVAKEKNAWYVDASAVVYPPLDDCLHISPESHHRLGEVMAAKIKEILG